MGNEAAIAQSVFGKIKYKTLIEFKSYMKKRLFLKRLFLNDFIKIGYNKFVVFTNLGFKEK